MNDPEPSEPIFEETEESPVTSSTPEEVLNDRQSYATPAGIAESIGWTFGVLALHVVGGIVAGILILLVFLSQTEAPANEVQEIVRDQSSLESMIERFPGLLIGTEMSVFALGVVFLVWLRFGRKRRSAIPLQMPSGIHVLIVLLWIIPLSLVGGQIAVGAEYVWNGILVDYPSLQSLDEMNVMELMNGLKNRFNPLELLLWVAVIPAFAEELVFRGVIGRGLVSRYGIENGVVITALLFASVHLHPVHAAALLPLAVAIHWSYLQSRNFWIPMVFHFLNNAWAVMALYLFSEIEPSETAEVIIAEDSLPMPVLTSAVVCIFVLGWLMLATRTVYLTESGEPWQSPVSITDGPAVPEMVSARQQKAGVKMWGLAIVSVATFWVTVFFTG